jgi:hypothetical protein
VLNPNKVGVRVWCEVCGQTKKPVGRSAPLGAYYCTPPFPRTNSLPGDTCPGYWLDPQPGHLWPGESEEEFGYEVPDAGTEIKQCESS